MHATCNSTTIRALEAKNHLSRGLITIADSCYDLMIPKTEQAGVLVVSSSSFFKTVPTL